MNEVYSVAYGNPDIKIFQDRLARGEDVSDFTIGHLPHYIPAYFLNQLIDHVDREKYIKIGSNPIFNDDGSSTVNDENIANLLEGNIPPLASVLHYSGEKKRNTTNEVDDAIEIKRMSKQADIFPSILTNDSVNLSTEDIFRRDDEAKGGAKWIPYHEKEKFDTLKTYSDRSRKRKKNDSPEMKPEMKLHEFNLHTKC